MVNGETTAEDKASLFDYFIRMAMQKAKINLFKSSVT